MPKHLALFAWMFSRTFNFARMQTRS